MKTALVCALIFGQFAAEGREPAAPRRSQCGCPSPGVVVPGGEYPAPVAEMTTGNGPTVGGAYVRVKTAPQPLLMFSPLAPPEYGSGRNLLTFTDDPYRTENPNVRREVRPIGIRILTLRPNW